LEKTTGNQSTSKDKNNIMANYIKKEYSGNMQRANDVKIVEKDVDISELAQAMAKALLGHLPQGVQGQQPMGQTLNNNLQRGLIEDTFDSTKTLENLAKSMLVNRNETESNMGDMSKNTVVTKNDNKDTNNTIDLLSGLDD
jgi:hypothetical protein